MGLGKKIVLVSSGQPSANPRLVKEAIALYNAGYAVTVVYCPMSPWSDSFDRDLFEKYSSIRWTQAGYHTIHQRSYFQFARLRRKMYQYLFRIFGSIGDTAVRSFVVYEQELSKITCSIPADLYIGHNLGGLSACVKAAIKNQGKAFFDFEDFHRGEDKEGSFHWKQVCAIEDKYVPKLFAASTAAPLITQAYAALYPSLTLTTINNCFSSSFIKDEPANPSGQALKLFWFSQFVGPKRGLETVIEAIGLTGNQSIELSLLGNCNEERKSYFSELANRHGLLPHQLHFLGPVPEEEIVQIASRHHIGLATEIPHILNRELCLTNKIFMYLLAGNALVFSRTKAQAAFLSSYPEVGTMYEQGDARQLAILLNTYIQKPSFLEQQRTASLALGKTRFNWEVEQELLLQHVKTAI